MTNKVAVVGFGPDRVLAERIASIGAPYVMVLEDDDSPVMPAVQAAGGRSDAALIVGDELRRRDDGVERIRTPVPDRYSVISRPIAAGPLIVSTDALRRVAGAASVPEGLWWAEMIRRVVAEGATRVDEVLVERSSPRPKPAPQQVLDWLEPIAADIGIRASLHEGSVHLSGEGNSDRSVSVIIPTAGAIGEVHGSDRVHVVDLLDDLIDDPPPEVLEVIVVIDAKTPTSVREAIRHCVPRAPFPVVELADRISDFSFSRKVNLGASVSAGSSLLLLNDDVLPITAGWLGRMCDLLRIDGVGTVGATLLYEDRCVQHAGIVGVDGMPDHFGKGRPYAEPFADGLWGTDRPSLAVTGAVLLTSATTWDRVGGFSPALPINFNDVDYCLKVRDSGEDVLVAGSAVLHHFESRSRDGRVGADEIDTLKARWLDVLLDDPFHPGGPAVVLADWADCGP